PQTFTGDNEFTGTLLSQNASDSTAAFQIQNSAGADLLQADTLNSRLIAGSTSGELQTWQTNSNALPQGLRFLSSVVANGYIYSIGGTTNNTSGIDTTYYAKLNSDGSTGAWQTASPTLPVPLGEAATVTANGYVYIIGGTTDFTNGMSSVYYTKLNSDGSIGVWQTSANPLPANRRFATAAVVNGYVYVMGGEATSPGQTTVYYAKLNPDGSTGTWTTSANSLPAGPRQHTGATANGYLYVMGGIGSTAIYYSLVNPDGSIGPWTTNATPLPDSRNQTSTVVANGYVYVIAGSNGSTSFRSYMYAPLNRDGSVGSWVAGANFLPDFRISHASVAANGYVYAIGGSTGPDFLNTVYYASTPRVLIGGSLDLVGSTNGNLADPGMTSFG
ncbi:MAG: Kelch repeat-containing protein, partial [bacterium]